MLCLAHKISDTLHDLLRYRSRNQKISCEHGYSGDDGRLLALFIFIRPDTFAISADATRRFRHIPQCSNTGMRKDRLPTP